ncbi:MAG TPA: hypothetical protein VNL16_13085 [Chloroflexota bacterium]|nr:hypothetical protein [Chloroflexota bacterium]
MRPGQVMSLGSVGVEVRAERRPAFGETLLGSDFLMTSGGKAANKANAVAATVADALARSVLVADVDIRAFRADLERLLTRS